MDTKIKQGQKGGESHAKQTPRPGAEQTRSGTSMERQSERQQPTRPSEQQKPKVQPKGGKK